ncbi:hypothetical protein SprV_0200888900 [Sparganum proliferum]
MVRQFDDGVVSRVTDNEEVCKKFAVTNGMKQGCVRAPTIFSLMFSAMLLGIHCDERLGIRIAYRIDGRVLSNRHMQAPTCLSTTLVHNLLFVDECTLNTATEEDMQHSVDLFAVGCAKSSLPVNTDKTVFMQQPPSNTEYNTPRINANGIRLKTMGDFAYLENRPSRITEIDDEVLHRLFKTGQAFGQLQAYIRDRHKLQLNNKRM